MEVGCLLVELYKVPSLQWLARALLLPLAMWVEEAWRGKEHSFNPWRRTLLSGALPTTT